MPVPLTRCIQMHTPSPVWVCLKGGGGWGGRGLRRAFRCAGGRIGGFGDRQNSVFLIVMGTLTLGGNLKRPCLWLTRLHRMQRKSS